jgi:autotransporter passenger strand-loop-strand repeat protein
LQGTDAAEDGANSHAVNRLGGGLVDDGAARTTVQSGGTQYVSGIANGDIVSEQIIQGGTAIGTMVGSR